MKTFSLILFLCSICVNAEEPATNDKINATPNAVGSTFTVKIPGAEKPMKLNLWLPDGQHEIKLPLLVVLDGQRYFNYAVSMHHMIQQYGWAPKFAVLGIDTSVRRWPTLMSQRQPILQALKHQVLPALQKQYPISDERILFGWEAAGGLTLRALMDEPTLFSSFIAASPSPLYGDYFPTLKDDHEAMVHAIKSISRSTHLYVAVGSYDYPQQLGVDELENALKSSSKPMLRQTFAKIDDASHASLGFEALLNGMRDYFYYFDKPEFADIATFYKKGGNAYLDRFFEIQAKQFGFDDEQIAKNRFEALRKLSFMLVMDDDIVQLQRFLEEQGEDFLNRSHLNHIYIYGMALLKHNKLDDAETMFSYLQNRHPEHARPLNGLGLVAKQRGDESRALKLFEQAVEFGAKNNDFRLAEYQQNLPNRDNSE